jgi:glucose-fructose oxidoreductase
LTDIYNLEIDAVYIAEPNSLHCDFTVRAARAGVHALCEKPLAVAEEECRRMIEECRRNHVKLMTAYRLHFDRANLEAINVVQSGKLGGPRYFNSIFSMQAKEGNIRLRKKMSGGTLYDIGVYCINAARYLFQQEPVEVSARAANNGEKRFREVEEMVAATLRFPENRLATFICSFCAADSGSYDVLGSEGACACRMRVIMWARSPWRSRKMTRLKRGNLGSAINLRRRFFTFRTAFSRTGNRSLPVKKA